MFFLFYYFKYIVVFFIKLCVYSLIVRAQRSVSFIDTLFVLFNSHDQRIHRLEGGIFHPYVFVGFSVSSFFIALRVFLLLF